jgi:plastocyanin
MKLVVAALLIGVAAGCSGNGAVNPLGAGGSGGTGGGSAGRGPGGAGGSGFVAVAPCNAASNYSIGATSISFGGAEGDSYNPTCLKVPAGTTVTFLGDFGNHPLAPSAARGTLTGNPIVVTSAGSTASFTFPAAGFWAFYCMVHGSDPDGDLMSGVVWVE